MRRSSIIHSLAVVVTLAVCASAQAQWTPSGSNIYNTNVGNVGIGTTAPAGKLHVSASNPYLYLTSPFPSTASVFSFSAGNNSSLVSGMAVYSQYTLLGSDTTSNWLMGLFGSRSFSIRDVSAGATRLSIDQSGNVGIGTTAPTATLEVVGTIKATNVIGASYQDFAEWVPAGENMTAGTVVVLDANRSNTVVPSSRPYDTSVAGVVSDLPGILLGEASDTKEKIATTGRVKVRVDATKTPVKVGDLLVSSDKPGTAMVSKPVVMEGVAFHRPGTIIGKALEPLSGGVGEVLVLLSMQ